MFFEFQKTKKTREKINIICTCILPLLFYLSINAITMLISTKSRTQRLKNQKTKI